jgi:pyruvate dehydrogenase E2 component (dihydrolipoamide acetyltransferase)
VTVTVATAVVEVLMPRLSDSMEEGTITAWHKGNGEQVARGDPIVDIETDKAVMTYESEASGVLQIVAPEGFTVALGGLIATLSPGDPAPSAPFPRAAAHSGNGGAKARVNASPVARRVAAAHSVDLTDLSGSGPNGRIVKRDVLAATDTPSAASRAAPVNASSEREPDGETPTSSAAGSDIRQISRLQQTIARRMSLAKSTQPEFTLEATADMTDAVSLRGMIKSNVPSDVPSLNDLVVKAAALALREHPVANGSFVDGTFELHRDINIGIAVAAQDALVVPVINRADKKSLGQIGRESRRLAAVVRTGEITAGDLSGGTFTISNLGMFGIDRFTAILNPPQAAILAVGAISEQPVFQSGEVVGRKLMSLTLTCDHRILYGATAAEFLQGVRSLLEAPWRLVL